MRVIDKILTEGIQSVSEQEYSDLIEKVKRVLEGKNLIEKDWNEFIVVGDTHGDIEAAKVPVEMAEKKGLPIVFLGDYVDRGRKQLENLAYVLDLKERRPDRTVLLRGNHESERMNRGYGFQRVVHTRYSPELFTRILSLYEELPITAVIDTFFLSHGGIPEGIEEIGEIAHLEKRDERYKEIMWNDPSEDVDWFEKNRLRGGYKLYGKKAVNRFLEYNSLSAIIRAHQCFPEGFKYFFDKKLLSIFSVPNYRGNPKGRYALVKDGKTNILDV
ncbi:MAG: metallophosphoesterase [Candidatus Thermoplasmatota archaeon]|nr:metallophosphoesterase [Candidatus Thermoplasmatota archaeon]